MDIRQKEIQASENFENENDQLDINNIIPEFRLITKKENDRFAGYEHYYHINANEPYGVCGSTVIWRKDFLEQKELQGLANGYKWEAYQNKRAATSTEKWVENYATDDRNLFGILHCIEKQKWIYKSKHILEKAGYKIEGRPTQTILETIISNMKDFSKRLSGRTRHRIKSLLMKIGFHFETEY